VRVSMLPTSEWVGTLNARRIPYCVHTIAANSCGRYGSGCYQKNADHLRKFRHPPKPSSASSTPRDYASPLTSPRDAAPVTSPRTRGASEISPPPAPPEASPPPLPPEAGAPASGSDELLRVEIRRLEDALRQEKLQVATRHCR
jgi:hypothetical protein